MSGGERHPVPEYLPVTIPIFPMSGALLLPAGRLPLDIFEPRYHSKTDDALGGGRMIGVVQPVHELTDPVSDTAEIFRTGCVGRITSFTETDDNRYQLTLTGICRFHVIDELARIRGYRRVSASYDAFGSDLEADSEVAVDRRRLIDAMQAYFEVEGIETEWESVEMAETSAIITSLAMICPFSPREKQALLESPLPDERAELLTSLMEMAVRNAGWAATEYVH